MTSLEGAPARVSAAHQQAEADPAADGSLWSRPPDPPRMCMLATAGDAPASSGPGLETDPGPVSGVQPWHVRSYPLDHVSRSVGTARKLRCDRESMVVYRGHHFGYGKPIRVHPAFTEKLVQFEGLVVELAIKHFGRPPRRLAHVGAFACRRTRVNPGWLSEHALGNGIDVTGFDFGPLPEGADNAVKLPSHLHDEFRVRVFKHFGSRAREHRRQRAFLRELASRLRASPDIFRTVLGPPTARHLNHLHLDHGVDHCVASPAET